MKELDYQVEQRKALFRRVKAFEGYPDSFDKSALKGEFARANGEAMTWAKLPAIAGKGATPGKPSVLRRFFFYKGRMWKIYDEYKLDAQGLFGADFKEATAKVEASAGAGAKRTRGPDSKYENVTFEAGPTRVRVVKLADDRVAIVRTDNALAQEVLDRRALQAKQPESGLDEDIQAVIR